MGVTVRVDPARCRGLGLCVGMAPQRFRLTGGGHSVPVDAYVSDPEQVALLHDIADCCPMAAVEVRPNDEPERHPETSR